MDATMKELIEKEWKMFHTVNGDNRVSCQENFDTFLAMRSAQFEAWSPETVESYLADVTACEKAERNLVREKYIRMMKSTDPNNFEYYKHMLPEVSEKKAALVAEIWEHMLVQTERMRKKYPVVAMGGRCLRAADEAAMGGTSIETYQTSELLTYSEKTLELFLAHLLAQEEKGIDIVYQIQENSIKCMGFTSMEHAERTLTREMQTCCGCTSGVGTGG